jgi:hypothetical protein
MREESVDLRCLGRGGCESSALCGAFGARVLGRGDRFTNRFRHLPLLEEDGGGLLPIDEALALGFECVRNSAAPSRGVLQAPISTNHAVPDQRRSPCHAATRISPLSSLCSSSELLWRKTHMQTFLSSPCSHFGALDVECYNIINLLL